MSTAPVAEAAATETPMVKSAMVKSVVKAVTEAEEANEPGFVETIGISIVIGILIRVPVGVGITVQVRNRISLKLRLYYVATRRHALQVVSLIERLHPAGTCSVRGCCAGGDWRGSGRPIRRYFIHRAARCAGGRTGRGRPGDATVAGVRHHALLADQFILLIRRQIFVDPRQYHNRRTRWGRCRTSAKCQRDAKRCKSLSQSLGGQFS
jgi:hypothetical protein